MADPQYYQEQIAHISPTYRGGAVGGQITNTNGNQPNANITNVGGGNQVIATSTDIDGKSQLDSAFAVSPTPDDTNNYASESLAPGFAGQTEIGNGAVVTKVLAESHVGPASTTGLKSIALVNTSVLSINSVFSGATIYPASGTAGPNASGAGWGLVGNSIVFNQGTYTNFVTPMASGWVPPTSDTFFVNYNYTSLSGSFVTTNPFITQLTPPGIQQAFLGNAGQTTQASSSFGGWDITR